VRRIAAAILAASCALSAGAATIEDVVLPLPRALHSGEALGVEVTIGALHRQRLAIRTAQGRYLGTISPFGVEANRSGGRYMIPVPADAVQDGRLALHLTVISGDEHRAPTASEVTSVTLMILPK
jgi:hypothetical protein